MLVLGMIAATSVSAHRRDEYLQAARVAIDPASVRVELDLTPGISVADDVVAYIDRDRDGSISAREGDAYIVRVVQGVSLDVDGTPLVARIIDHAFPPVELMRQGEGTIRIVLTAALPHLGSGMHRFRYRNSHRSDIGVYLANALVPASDEVRVTDQQRDVDQRSLEVAFTLERPAHYAGWMFVGGVVASSIIALAFARRCRIPRALNRKGHS